MTKKRSKPHDETKLVVKGTFAQVMKAMWAKPVEKPKEEPKEDKNL